MGMAQISDEVQQTIEREVERGRASSASAYVERAAARTTEDDAEIDGDEVEPSAELLALIQQGIDDIEAGRYVTINNAEESRSRRLLMRSWKKSGKKVCTDAAIR